MSLMQRLAGAPISWGVCEVPGWGVELAPRRVLAEMRECGLRATELGSDGYLPADPSELKDLCAEYELTMIGGFVPLVLHEPDQLDATIAAAADAQQHHPNVFAMRPQDAGEPRRSYGGASA